jgi:murein DD-endopeptidase MepM/ murein hydrolase activator NlpD
MSLKSLLGISGCAVVGFFLAFVVLVIVLLAIFIELFLPFGKEQAWAWMLNVPQNTERPPQLPPSNQMPIISGDGQWCVTKAYRESDLESHYNAGRVQGYVYDANGNPLPGATIHVGWDGDEGGITQTTDQNGHYVFILSPGAYRVFISDGHSSQAVFFRENVKPGWGHITYDVNFQFGNCMTQVASYSNNAQQPCGLPVDGPITAGFHDPQYYLNFGRPHEGVDIAVPIGTPVHATLSGKVIGAGYFSGGYGNMIKIQNGPWATMFEHLSRLNVQVGQVVNAGEVVGWSGNTGNSTGPHVHYQVDYNGYPVDPLYQFAYNGDFSLACAFGFGGSGGNGSIPVIPPGAPSPIHIANWPQPQVNNGRCIDWFPTVGQSQKVVDTFVPILQAMGVHWVVVLQDPSNPTSNDYLFWKLSQAGITPIVRLMMPIGAVDTQALGVVVARDREMGVRYFQIFNEPNNPEEWGWNPFRSPQWLARYWLAAAQVVVANGGLPGLTPFSPHGDDLAQFTAVLQELKQTASPAVLNAMWLSVHNYGGMDSNGFFRYRQYEQIAQNIFGRTVPVIGTEGGTGTANSLSGVIDSMFGFMAAQRESYFLAFCPWLIGNEIGGSKDPTWEDAAWCVGALDHPKCRVQVGLP